MSTALTSIKENQYTPDQMRLITDVVAKGASKDELQLFLYRCQNLGLDPLKPGQIYFIKYGNGPGTIVVGIEGFRARAAKTGKLSGIKRGALRDDKGNLIGAFAEVYRSDWKEPAREEVPLAEYNTGKGNWSKMPETMIKKVAEAAALRMAFPDDLGGVYTKEEMEQAEGETKRGFSLAGNGDTSIKPGYLIYSQYRGKSCVQVERDEGRGALIEEKDRLAPINNIDAQKDYHTIDEHLRLSDGVAVENEDSEPTEPEPKADPVCCGKVMMVSKYLDKVLNCHPYYCMTCKKKIPRDA